jgi:hypothetical protein
MPLPVLEEMKNGPWMLGKRPCWKYRSCSIRLVSSKYSCQTATHHDTRHTRHTHDRAHVRRWWGGEGRPRDTRVELSARRLGRTYLGAQLVVGMGTHDEHRGGPCARLDTLEPVLDPLELAIRRVGQVERRDV